MIVKLFTGRLPPFFFRAFPNIFRLPPGPSWPPQCLPGELKIGLCSGDGPLEAPGQGFCQASSGVDELEGACWPPFPLIQALFFLPLFLLPTSSTCSYFFLYSGISLPALISHLQPPLLALGLWKSQNARDI